VLKDLINEPKLHGLLRAHKLVSLHVPLDVLQLLARVPHVNEVELPLELDDLLCLDLNVCGLSARAARRLVHHDARVWQRVAHARLAGRQEEAAHAASLAHAPRGDRGEDVLHCVVDGQAGCHATYNEQFAIKSKRITTEPIYQNADGASSQLW
jgi:hypothetical protein